MKPTPYLRHLLAALGGSLLAVSSASAADGTWTLNNNGNWSATGNWSGGTVADGTDSSAFLGNVINNNRNITVDIARTIGHIYAQDTSHNYSIIGANTLTLDTSGGLSVLDVVSGRTLTISAPLTINDGIQKTGAGALTVSSAATLGSSQTWQVDAGIATFNGIIGDGGNAYSITKTGAGRLDFGGVNHTFSGGLIINGGEVQFRKNDNGGTDLGLGAGNITINGGVAAAYWGYTFSRGLGTGANQVQITGGVSGFGGNGATGGTFSLDTGVGNPAISWGDAAFNPSEFVLQSSGANTNGKSTFTNHIDLNGDGGTPDGNGVVWRTIRSDQTGYNFDGYGIFSGNITNSGTTNLAGLIKTGIGQHILSGTNTYDGGTQVNEGTLTVTAPGALAGYDTSGKVIVAGGAMLAVRNSGWSAANIDDLRANATWSANTSTLGFDTSGTFTYASDITEALSIAQIGTGTLVLGGNNSYTGSTTLHRGTLRADSANALGSGGDITFLGGTLQYTANSAGTDFGSRITNSTSAISLNTNGQDVTLSNLGSGNTGGLTKSGGGMLTVSGANYSGGTTVSTGTLTFTGTNTYSGATTLSGGTIAVYDGTLSTSGGAVSMVSNTSISVLGGTGVTSTWNLGGQQLGTANNSYTNVQIVIDGDGVEGSALVTNVGILAWGRTASGTAETPSTILLTDGGQMNVNGEVRIGNPYYSEAGYAYLTIGGGTATSTFSGDGGDDFYIGFGERTGSKNNAVTVSANGVLTNIRDMYVGHINNAQNNDNPTTNNQLLVAGGSASMRGLTLGYIQTTTKDALANVVSVTNGGTLSTTGATYIGRATQSTSTSNANTLTVSGTASSWDAGNQDVFVGHTSNASAASNNNVLTVGADGEVTNVAALTVGTGTGTETGNQLVVNGSLTATSVTISNGNSLAGGGTINGAVTVNADANVTPGASAGTLNIVGSLNISAMAGGAGLLNYELDTLAASDRINVTGTLDIGSGALGLGDFNLTDLGGLQNGTYKLIETSQPITGTLAGDTNGTLGSATIDLQISGDGTDLELVVSGLGAGDPYDTWSGSLPFDDDANGDGVSNGLAFLLGAAGPNADALDLLPTVSESGGGLVMTFSMLDAASRGTASLAIEHSSDLGISDTWTTVAVPDSSGGPTSGVTFVVTGAGTLDVTATIGSGESALGKLFGRLKAVKP